MLLGLIATNGSQLRPGLGRVRVYGTAVVVVVGEEEEGEGMHPGGGSRKRWWEEISHLLCSRDGFRAEDHLIIRTFGRSVGK